jgi:anti-repressor protein
MKELVKISKQAIGDEEVNAVSSIELHETLEVKSNHRDWIKNRIKDLGLIEGIDYLPIKIERKLESGTKHAKDYII